MICKKGNYCDVRHFEHGYRPGSSTGQSAASRLWPDKYRAIRPGRGQSARLDHLDPRDPKH
jgi:hypothetical protein